MILKVPSDTTQMVINNMSALFSYPLTHQLFNRKERLLRNVIQLPLQIYVFSLQITIEELLLIKPYQ